VTWRQVSWKELPYREHSWQHDCMMQVYGEQPHGTAWHGRRLLYDAVADTACTA
jgi:hypothetical protein